MVAGQLHRHQLQHGVGWWGAQVGRGVVVVVVVADN